MQANEKNMDLTIVVVLEAYDSSLIIKKKGKLNDIEKISDKYITDFSKFTEEYSQNFNIRASLIENLV